MIDSGSNYSLPNFEPIDPLTAFEDLGPPYESAGRPDDYPGFELQFVLWTPGGRYRAGKSYRPDPSGAHRAVKVSDYSLGTTFLCTWDTIEGPKDIFELLKNISGDPHAFLVRGQLAEWAVQARAHRHRMSGVIGSPVKARRAVEIHGYDGFFHDVPRQLQLLDLDGVPLPDGMSIVTDPEACISWAIEHLLPPEFREASFVYQLSASAGLSKRDDELNVHLWYFTDHEYWNEELRIWARWWNAKQHRKIIDPAVFNTVQPLYTNEPELLDGLMDPLAGRRLGLIQRTRRTVRLYMPTEQEVRDELGSRQRRATAQYRRAIKSDTREPPADNTAGEVVEGLEEETGEDALPFGPYFDAVKLGSGWRGYLMGIGFEGHIRTQIRAAIGSYFREKGSRADRAHLKAAIEGAIEQSPFLDCAEPWSRPRQDARDYLDATSDHDSNVDQMIVDIAASERSTEALAFEVHAPSWSLPSITADEAFVQVDTAIRQVAAEAYRFRNRQLDPFPSPDPFAMPSQTAILCDPGVGKTEAMINAIVELLRTDPHARIAVAVPTHDLGRGLADRINGKSGSPIAAEWHGLTHSDPHAPSVKMCLLAEAASQVVSAGGKAQFLCSSQQHGFCPHHPRMAGAQACGYLRQQQPAIRNAVHVWIVPSVMLATAPPPALRRQGSAPGPDFDLLVIDEAPWFGLLGGVDGEPVGADVEWLSPDWWEGQLVRGRAFDKAPPIQTLAKIYALLSRHDLGEVPAAAFDEAGIDLPAVLRARRFVYKCKRDIRRIVNPGSSVSELRPLLSIFESDNRRILAVAEALRGIVLRLQGKLGPSGLELTERSPAGERFLRVRWRKEIHRAWRRGPVLYLDAAGTNGHEIAKAWLPEIVLGAEIRASARNMRVTQIVDSAVSYRKISDDNNAEKLARMIETRASNGLVISPKSLRDKWEREKRLPGRTLWNFQGLRGRDEARDVPQLTVVSRPLPPPAEVEIMAETIFGQRVQRLPAGEFYPKEAIGRLMADGSGRRALALRHPHPLVETVRFAVCEGELLQAIGRGRGVRRTAEAPLDVLLLTDVPLPVPVDVCTTWKDLTDSAGPMEILALRCVIPLDYAGIAAALPDRFNDADAAMEWFRFRPAQLKSLNEIRAKARAGKQVDIRELVGNSNKDISIGNSHQLAPFMYRRSDKRQSNLILVNATDAGDPRRAIETVLGPIDRVEPVGAVLSRRRQRGASKQRHHSELIKEVCAFIHRLLKERERTAAVGSSP